MNPRDRYLEWLRGLVTGERGPSVERFFFIAWSIPFEPIVDRDENRATDGIDLRYRFEEETSIRLPEFGPCTMIELFISIAIRANHVVYNWEVPDQVPALFWEFMDNLKIINPRLSDDEIEGILIRFNNRDYAEDGSDGGIFPLMNPQSNQREIEIWYQMQAYLMEGWLD